MKVKIFNTVSASDLEKRASAWLRGHPDVTIRFVAQSESAMADMAWSYSLTIFYTEMV